MVPTVAPQQAQQPETIWDDLDPQRIDEWHDDSGQQDTSTQDGGLGWYDQNGAWRHNSQGGLTISQIARPPGGLQPGQQHDISQSAGGTEVHPAEIQELREDGQLVTGDLEDRFQQE